MTIDVPVLRLGLAGFSEAQQAQIAQLLREATTGQAQWRIGAFTESDAWWLEGAHAQILPSGLLRINPAQPTQRAVQLAPAEVDRPVAFSLPVAARDFQPTFSFDLAQPGSAVRILQKFAAWLQPMVAQYCLAASVAEHQPALGSGAWEVVRGSDLLAVVDVRLGTAVAPQASAADFAEATWLLRDPDDVHVPDDFARASLSHLMWQYALRTDRDLLPAHYRARPLFFRRPPRLHQRELSDGHLLLLRELSLQPGARFEHLQQATGFEATQLARALAALYFVGSITANPKRAGGFGDSRPDSGAGVLPSVLESGAQPARAMARRTVRDLTVPAPLVPE